MSVRALEPAGFTDAMRFHALRTKYWGLHLQGMGVRDFGVWLAIDGNQTLIGHGTLSEALVEAESSIAMALARLRGEAERINETRNREN